MKKFSFFLMLFTHFILMGQTTSIPDDNFELRLIELGLDDIKDNKVNTQNISSITELDVSSNQINTLTGIEDFTALVSLTCTNNNLFELNVSNNIDLVYLACDNNNISVLELTSNTSLSVLNCSYNDLIALNLTTNTELTQLYCPNNDLEVLNVQNNNNTSLNLLYAYQNSPLECIQVDNVSYSQNADNWLIDSEASYSEECNLLGLFEFLNGIKKEIKLYPNPVESEFEIKTPENHNIENIIVLDMKGKVIFKQLISTVSEQYRFDLSTLKTGIYIVKIITDKNSFSRHLIKK